METEDFLRRVDEIAGTATDTSLKVNEEISERHEIIPTTRQEGGGGEEDDTDCIYPNCRQTEVH